MDGNSWEFDVNPNSASDFSATPNAAICQKKESGRGLGASCRQRSAVCYLSLRDNQVPQNFSPIPCTSGGYANLCTSKHTDLDDKKSRFWG